MSDNPFAHAACRGYPPGWWYPDTRRTVEADRAIAICSDCPIRHHCYETALRGKELGIWGGVLFNPGNSRRLRKQARTAA